MAELRRLEGRCSRVDLWPSHLYRVDTDDIPPVYWGATQSCRLVEWQPDSSVKTKNSDFCYFTKICARISSAKATKIPAI